MEKTDIRSNSWRNSCEISEKARAKTRYDGAAERKIVPLLATHRPFLAAISHISFFRIWPNGFLLLKRILPFFLFRSCFHPLPLFTSRLSNFRKFTIVRCIRENQIASSLRTFAKNFLATKYPIFSRLGNNTGTRRDPVMR